MKVKLDQEERFKRYDYYEALFEEETLSSEPLSPAFYYDFEKSNGFMPYKALSLSVEGIDVIALELKNEENALQTRENMYTRLSQTLSLQEGIVDVDNVDIYRDEEGYFMVIQNSQYTP